MTAPKESESIFISYIEISSSFETDFSQRLQGDSLIEQPLLPLISLEANRDNYADQNNATEKIKGEEIAVADKTGFYHMKSLREYSKVATWRHSTRQEVSYRMFLL